MKVLIAMSGGVDSSAAALLLRKEGYDCAGAMMRLYAPAGIQTGEQDAANAAAALEMPFFVYDMQKDFQKWVIQDFINVYRSGGTPNQIGRASCRERV